MDIFGIGFSELLFIFLIALMIFGPRRLPQMAAKAGKFIRDLRSMSQGFMTEWQREIAAAAQLEELQEARKELELTRQELQQARVNVASEVGGAKKDLNKSLAAASKAATSPETKKETAAAAEKSPEGETSPAGPEPAAQQEPASPKSQPDPPAVSAEPPLPENTISPFTGSPSSPAGPASPDREAPEDKGQSAAGPQPGSSARVEAPPAGDNGRPVSADGAGAASAHQEKLPDNSPTPPSAASDPVAVRSDTLNE